MDEATTKTRFWTHRRRLWAVGAAVATLLLTAGGHWLPDWGLRYGLLRSLRDLGWSQVSVAAANLSLFNGAIVVRQVTAGEELGRMLGIDGLNLDFRWKPLFSRRVSLERLALEGVDVEARREGADWVVNGLPLTVGGGGEGGSSWSYEVSALSLTASRIHLTDGPTRAEIEVDRLDLADLKSWEPALPARFQMNGRINGAPFSLEGTATPFADRPGFAFHLGLDQFDLAAVAEAARSAGLGQVSGRANADLAVQGDLDGRITAAGTLGLKAGGWADGGTKVNAAELALAFDNLAWDAGGVITAAGTAAAQELRVEDGGVAVTAATAQLAARSAKYEAKPGRLSWDGTLHAERHQLVAGDTRIEHASLDWAGATRFDFAAAAASFLHAEGKAAAAGTRIAVGPLALEAERMTAEGVFQHARPDGMLPPLAGRMDAALDNVWVREPGLDWMRASHVQVGDLRLTPGANASLGRLEAQGLAVLARPGKGGFPWRLEARQAVMERATLAGDGTSSFGSVALAGARARATRTKDGFLGLPETTNEAAPDSARPRMILRRLHLGGDSRIDFVDRSLSEPVRLTLEGVEVDMSDLDSFRPDHDSPFTAKARIGAAQLSAQGRARPFAALVGGEMKGTVRALELPPLSPYAADTMGVHLQTGQLDAELALSITQGKLDGGMQLVLNELFVAQPDPNAPLAKSADMPVETVLDLLRDSDNRIRLSIPVRGDLANPDFDVSDAVGQAVGGALRSTVFTTLKVAFPLAGLISLVIDDSESRRLALEPLGFAPGSETLGAAETKRLDAVAALMAQRPTLKLTLCGVATQEGDGPALAERRRLEELGLLARLQNMVGAAPNPRALPVDAAQLTRLADARALAAKTFLVEQRNVDPGRLFVCRPRVEADAKALPRVDLVL